MQRFKNVLYVSVFDSVGKAALERAVTLANNNQASLTVVEVIDKLPANVMLPNAFHHMRNFTQRLF